MENGRGQTSDDAQPWVDIHRILSLPLPLVQRGRDTGCLGDGRSRRGLLRGSRQERSVVKGQRRTTLRLCKALTVLGEGPAMGGHGGPWPGAAERVSPGMGHWQWGWRTKTNLGEEGE